MSDGEVKGSFYRTEIIAQLFGVTVRRVQQLTQEGIISTTKILEDGKSVRRYDLVPTIQAYVKYLSDKAYGKQHRTDKEIELREQKMQADIALKKILTAKDIKVSQDSRWTKHNILQNVPRGEFSGPDTMGVTLTITLSAEHGVKPRSTVEKIRKANRSGQVEYLVIGGKIMGSNKMAITATSETWDAIYNKGELVKAKIDVTFMEYS